MSDYTYGLFIADSCEISRNGLISMIQENRKLKLVADSSSVAVLYPITEQYNKAIFILNINDKEDISNLKLQPSSCKYIMLTDKKHLYKLCALNRTDIKGILPKNIRKSELYNAIELVLQGEKYYSDVFTRLIEKIQIVNNGLSPREETIFNYIVHGFNNSEIGQKLNISKKTVDTHRTRLMQKLDAHNIVELIRYAFYMGHFKECLP